MSKRIVGSIEAWPHPGQRPNEAIFWSFTIFRSGIAIDRGFGRLGGAAIETDAGLGRLCPHRRQERPDAHDVDDARQIVGQHVQRHLGGDLWQCLHQEVDCAHPGLDGAERVLDRLTALPHLLRMLIEPALHRLENVLVLPSGDPALLCGGAGILDGAILADIGPVAAQHQCVFRVSGPNADPTESTLMDPIAA